MELVPALLKPTDHVLDIGTGGGEKLITLAGSFGSAIGVDADPAMIETARDNVSSELADTIEFTVGDANNLPFDDATFDAVLNRHSVVNPAETVRVLRPGGLFINQNVGPMNLQNLIDPWRHMGSMDLQDPRELADEFVALGCEIEEFREYNVDYAFLDEASLLFQIKAMPMPVPVVAERDAELIAGLMESTRGADGAFHSNEHRFLTVVKKPV